MSGAPDEIGVQAPRPLRPEDVETAARAAARAFAWHEPWGAWVLPEESTREETLFGLIAKDIRERFLPAGLCSTIGRVSLTLWIPPAGEPGADLFAARRGEAEYRLYGERASALREADRRLDALQPEGPHWYLDTIATDPAYRRRGLGGRLLDHDLSIHDAHERACALDTHTIENVRFYEKRGFEVIAEDRIPGGGPDLWVMARPSAARGAPGR